jgi:RNA polymerase sigma factor (sigma-70 family)
MGAEIPPLTAEALEALLWSTPAPLPASASPPLGAQLGGQIKESLLREISDEALALAIQNGIWADQAFQELFGHRAMRYFYKWFIQWCVEFHLAQDLAQELILRFWRNGLATYQASCSFAAYLRQAAWNLLQEKRRKRSPTIVPNESLESGDSAPGPLEEAVGNELRQRVLAAAGKLSAKHAEVIRRFLDGEKPGETAQALHCGIGRVYRMMFQARRRIEADLGH